MQTSYTQYGDAAFAGLLDSVGPRVVASYAAEEAIPVAYPVRLGNDKDKEVLKATTGANAIGFALHDQAREQNSAGLVQYGVTETVSVLKQGRLWVNTSDAVVAGSTANLTTATGSLTDAAVAAGIEAFTQMNVKFITSTSGPGLAIVEIK